MKKSNLNLSAYKLIAIYEAAEEKNTEALRIAAGNLFPNLNDKSIERIGIYDGGNTSFLVGEKYEKPVYTVDQAGGAAIAVLSDGTYRRY